MAMFAWSAKSEVLNDHEVQIFNPRRLSGPRLIRIGAFDLSERSNDQRRSLTATLRVLRPCGFCKLVLRTSVIVEANCRHCFRRCVGMAGAQRFEDLVAWELSAELRDEV